MVKHTQINSSAFADKVLSVFDHFVELRLKGLMFSRDDFKHNDHYSCSLYINETWCANDIITKLICL